MERSHHPERVHDLFLSVQERLPLFEMSPPRALAPPRLAARELWRLQSLTAIRFARPLYVRLLAVLLVALIGTAGAYAVVLRPLDEVVVNAGTLILGVWGVRSILVADGHNFLSALELSLCVVVLFMLVVITVRVLRLCRQRGRDT
jgi:hypothetical protein